MKPVIIFGTGKVAEVIHYFLANESEFEIAGFTCDREHLTEDTFEGLPVVPFDEITTAYPADDYSVFVALGYQDMNALRADRVAQARELGYELISFIHASSGLPKDAQVGQNCFIMNNVHIQPRVVLGDNVFVWSGALIGHHVTLGDNCWVTSMANICGQVNIGRNCFFAANATVANGISVGDNCFLGANSLVTKNLATSSVVVQEPSKIMPVTSEQFMRMTRLR